MYIYEVSLGDAGNNVDDEVWESNTLTFSKKKLTITMDQSKIVCIHVISKWDNKQTLKCLNTAESVSSTKQNDAFLPIYYFDLYVRSLMLNSLIFVVK